MRDIKFLTRKLRHVNLWLCDVINVTMRRTTRSLSRTMFATGVMGMRGIRNAYIAKKCLLGENLKSKASFVIGDAMGCGGAKIALARTPRATRTGGVGKDYFSEHDYRSRFGEKPYSNATNILARNAAMIKEGISKLITLSHSPYSQNQDTMLTTD